jgi:serine/threonine protein kinase
MREFRRGDILDKRYKIESCIGVGGMGEVFRARRTLLGDIVAIKIIRARSGNTKHARKRFVAEARMCALLRHPHIVSVLDFGLEEGVGPYLVMEHLNGQSLRQQLRERGPLTVAEVCNIASQVASALDLAHSHGIVHRDLKPGNVMTHHYTAGEFVYKVIDFGIGGLQGPDSTSAQPEDSGRVLVTLTYASPEQLSGRPISMRSDIYSLGVTVYELLTGRPPFVESEAGSLLTQHLSASPERPTHFRAEIPLSAEAAVLKALAKDPESRWESASEFAQALSGGAQERPVVLSASASRLVDGYELGEVIGQGRFGSDVYKGTHRPTGHPVAIRIIRRKQGPQWDAARTPFMREARMTPVNHPSVLRIRDYGEEKDLMYVVTDFVPGPSLREVLERDGPIGWSRGRALLLDLISATCALHAQGLLAFGVTPSIIRIDTSGERERLVVSLAGAADIREVLPRGGSEPTSGFEPVDAPAFYLAPELLIGEKPDGRSDIFMIGAVGYELFTGVRPFSVSTFPQLVAAAFSIDVVDPRTYAPSLPEGAALCLLRCLARRPDQRFSDATELENIWLATPSPAQPNMAKVGHAKSASGRRRAIERIDRL